MTIMQLFFQLMGILATSFILCVGIGIGLRFGLGTPSRLADQRKDQGGLPF